MTQITIAHIQQQQAAHNLVTFTHSQLCYSSFMRYANCVLENRQHSPHTTHTHDINAPEI